ncbi:HWE histidine kinase domain-containing protein [Sphingomonas gilva]|uniref:HWE histidine kinase domain-containing protein n=1 Tax=Sphingomonas gilva TaxID=2305907 RepID=UPI0015FCFE23|nr:HWE histidine kinase domain-containing protein [Sphingomonas gilva]
MSLGAEDAGRWRGRVAELERLLEQERHEAGYRVRNILSVIRSIARRRDADCIDVDDYHTLLDGRLASFCRAQVALLRNPKKGVELGAMVGDELLAAGMRLDHAHLPAAPLFLSDRAVGIVALVLHELVGLMDDADDLTVGWNRSEAVRIDWRARFGRDAETIDSGFLREIVEQAIRYELSGEGVLQIEDGWLTCRIVLPVGCDATGAPPLQ